jgi:NitT/TauT family transport system permease protein
MTVSAEAAPATRKAAGPIRRRLYRHGALALVVIGWWVLSLFYPPDIVPGPLQLLKLIWQIVSVPGSWVIILTTLARILFGLVLSMLIGVPIGIAMGSRDFAERFLRSWIVVLLGMPAVAWAFLGVLWFGVGDAAPVFTIVLVALPVIALNIWQGVKSLNRDLYQMARVFKASNILTYRYVVIPHLLPYLYSSVKIGFALGWKIALIGEVFGVTAGVGREFMYWFQNFRIDMMLAWALTFMTLMASIEVTAFRRLDQAAFGWRSQI